MARCSEALVAGEDELAGVEAGLGLGDAAVVDLDLLGRACEDEAGGCAGSAGNAQALGAGCSGGADGDGNLEIRDVYDLQAMKGFLNSDFILAGDIDASSTANWNAGAGFVPVGNSGTPFNGGLNGNSKTISGLTITGTSNYADIEGSARADLAGSFHRQRIPAFLVPFLSRSATGGMAPPGAYQIQSQILTEVSL